MKKRQEGLAWDVIVGKTGVFLSHLALLHAAACACCLAGWSGRFASPPLQTGAGPGFPRSAAPGGLEAIAILKQASLCVSLLIVQAVTLGRGVNHTTG